MRLVDLLYSYLIRIVLLGITYVYLAETRSIGTPGESFAVRLCVEEDRL